MPALWNNLTASGAFIIVSLLIIGAVKHIANELHRLNKRDPLAGFHIVYILNPGATVLEARVSLGQVIYRF